MQRLRQLVTGTDFSEGAEQALALALELACAAGAKVTLVHVCELGADDLDDLRLAQCEEKLARLVARHRHPSVELTGVLRSGRPWEKLDNVAAEVGASLIVIGRHGAGLGGPGERGTRTKLGSVAERLIRSASRPVLTVANDFDRLVTEADDSNRI